MEEYYGFLLLMWVASLPSTIYCEASLSELSGRSCVGLFQGPLLYSFSLQAGFLLVYVAFLTVALVYFEIKYFDTSSIVLFAEGCFCLLRSFVSLIF